MVRTQIQLTEDQALILKKMAAKQRKSMAELIRRAIDQMVDSSTQGVTKACREKARAVSGKFRSGIHDLSTDHDRYLSEDFGS